jgi:C1A family cysteine protease
MPKPNPPGLNRILKETNARWKAKPTKKAYSLGYTPGPEEHALATREVMARANHQQFMAAAAVRGPAYPVSFDWRNVGGKNYVTSIKDQKQCGSCVAFGSVATVESNVRVQKHQPTLNIDLSEADLFFCHDGVAGGSCAGGWNVNPALTVFKNTGVPDDKCFPYTDHQQPCKRCVDWKKRVTRIKAFQAITAVASMKAWLAKYGPLVTCFTVYQDFFQYHTGIYHHVSGAVAGGHCVCCIGYNDLQRFWICKNSWGPGWGDHGFFKIAYGQVGIDAMMWGVEI